MAVVEAVVLGVGEYVFVVYSAVSKGYSGIKFVNEGVESCVDYCT